MPVPTPSALAVARAPGRSEVRGAASRPLPAPDRSPFRQQEVPPPGVAAQLGFEAGGESCQAVPAAGLGPRVTLYEDVFAQASPVLICMTGFQPNQPVVVQIVGPAGVVRRVEEPGDRDGAAQAVWIPFPTDALGTYTVTALQSGVQAVNTFTLRPVQYPALVLAPDGGGPGTTFQIGLAGFQPHQRVALFLYRSGVTGDCADVFLDCQWVYLAALPPAEVDAQGQTIYHLPTRADDPENRYKVAAIGGIGAHAGYPYNEMLLKRGVRPSGVPFTPGQLATTRAGEEHDLWNAPAQGARVAERPRLYGGTVLTVLAATAAAVQVRTEDNVEGWIHVPAAQALSNDLTAVGEQLAFAPGVEVQVVWPNGVPLRVAPRSDAPKVITRLSPGQRGTVQALRGDWVQVVVDGGMSGWARWYYDGHRYLDPVRDP